MSVLKTYSFGKRSLAELRKAKDSLQLIFKESITHSPIDFSIVDTARTFEEQLNHFLKGNSKLDPRVLEHLKRAKHVTYIDRPKAEAVDIALYVPERPDLAYHKEGLILVAGHILSTANRLFTEGRIKELLRWGGNWDQDFEIVTDQGFDDLPHYELI